MRRNHGQRQHVTRIVPPHRTKSIAHVICAKGNGNTPPPQFVQPGQPAPVRRSLPPVLQVKVRLRQDGNRDTGLSQLVSDPRNVTFGAIRKRAGMTAQDRPPEPNGKRRVRNPLQPVKPRLQTFIHMKVKLQTKTLCLAKHVPQPFVPLRLIKYKSPQNAITMCNGARITPRMSTIGKRANVDQGRAFKQQIGILAQLMQHGPCKRFDTRVVVVRPVHMRAYGPAARCQQFAYPAPGTGPKIHFRPALHIRVLRLNRRLEVAANILKPKHAVTFIQMHMRLGQTRQDNAPGLFGCWFKPDGLSLLQDKITN